MESPTVLCIDDRPQVLELRKSDSGISWLFGPAGVEQLHRDKNVGANIGGRGSTGVQAGRHGRGSRGLPDQAKVSQPADHSAFSVQRNARANPMVGG